MNFRGKVNEGVDCIEMCQYRIHWQSFVGTLTNLLVVKIFTWTA